MNSNKADKEQFGPLLQLEQEARDMYKRYVDTVKDAFLAKRLKEIYKDEKNHVAIVEGFIKGFQK